MYVKMVISFSSNLMSELKQKNDLFLILYVIFCNLQSLKINNKIENIFKKKQITYIQIS